MVGQSPQQSTHVAYKWKFGGKKGQSMYQVHDFIFILAKPLSIYLRGEGKDGLMYYSSFPSDK